MKRWAGKCPCLSLLSLLTDGSLIFLLFMSNRSFISGMFLVCWRKFEMIGKIIQLGSQLFSTAILIFHVIRSSTSTYVLFPIRIRFSLYSSYIDVCFSICRRHERLWFKRCHSDCPAWGPAHCASRLPVAVSAVSQGADRHLLPCRAPQQRTACCRSGSEGPLHPYVTCMSNTAEHICLILLKCMWQQDPFPWPDGPCSVGCSMTLPLFPHLYEQRRKYF